ncbi:hypothetical protein [Bdellovibrio sp. GT3]|uniref:hypothetical protein n=1 Tax=Bdellovibrio sp. GT3 TaxID=3136282 RepID=UPI0030F05B06
MFVNTIKISNDSNTLQEEFMSIALNISEMLKGEGKTVRPFVEGLPHFSKLPTEKKLHIIQQVRFYQELCQGQLNDGYKISDSPTFTWRAFRHLGLAPCKDFFSFLTQDDIVEIYSKDQIQLFRNFTFFDFCSYTLEELYTFEWWNLFQREEKHTQMILDEVAKVISGEIQSTYEPGLPAHELREIRSAERYSMTMSLRCLAPVYKNKQIEGLVVLERARILNN